MSNFTIRLISSFVLIFLIVFIFSFGKSLILPFCGLITFLLFLEINKSTLVFNNKNQILISPFLGLVTPFFLEKEVILLTICFIIFLLNIFNSQFRFLRIFSHIYVLSSLYLFLTLICNITETLNLIQPLFLISLVVASDVGGYIIGKSIGKHKIFSKISPNKSFEGVLGSIFACLLIWITFFVGFTDNIIIEIISVTFVCFCAQFGDLLVSLAKRRLRIKDSSNFIPGHGGVFDRMDSIIGGILGYSLIVFLGYGL